MVSILNVSQFINLILIIMLPGLIATAGGSLLSSFLNNRAQRKADERNYSNQVRMFNLTNEYNTPLNQRKRMEEAGLNPNLMYGQGTVGNASMPKIPDSQPREQPDFGQIAGTALAQYYDTRVKQAQIDNLQADLTNKNLASAKIAVDTDSKKFDLGLKTELKDTSMQVAKEALKRQQLSNFKASMENEFLPKKWKAELENSYARLAQIKSQTSLQGVEHALKSEQLRLRKQGIEISDNLFFRLFAPFLPSTEQTREQGDLFWDRR